MVNKLYPDNQSLKKAHLDYPDIMKEGWKPWVVHSNIGIKLKLVSSLIHDNSVLLDVGCNSGEMGLMFKEVNNCDVYGVDISSSLVKLANGKGIKAVVGDAERLPYKDCSFDCVYLGEMLEHSYNPGGILSDIRRVLKPGGQLVGNTINEIWMSRNIPVYRWEDERLHSRQYDTGIMRNLLKKFFDNIKVKNLLTDKSSQAWIIFSGRKSNA